MNKSYYLNYFNFLNFLLFLRVGLRSLCWSGCGAYVGLVAEPMCWTDQLGIIPTQPSLAGVGAGAELGKNDDHLEK